MESVQSLKLDQIEAKEIVPGFHGKFIHTDRMTLAYWSIDNAASLPEHAHPHEQVVNLLEGEFELTVDGQVHSMKPGDVIVIPGNVPHHGRALSNCRILDVFQPTREDYR